MGSLRRRTRLELAALVVLVGTVVTIAVVGSGLLRDDRARTAQRVTGACAPLARTIAPGTPPAEVMARDVAGLRLEMGRVADRLGEVAKDARGEARGQVLAMIDRIESASDEFSTNLSVRQRAEILTGAGQVAAALGASCPSPLSPAEGDAIDQAQALPQSRAGRANRRQPR